MIYKFSEALANKLLTKESITKDEVELYAYGIFMLLSHSMYLVLALILGLLTKCLLESIIFYFAFQCIRRFAGGYHASTELRCTVITSFSIGACIGLINLSKAYNFSVILLILALVCAIIVLVLSPLDTPEKPLSKKEYKYFRRIARIICICISVGIILSYCFKLNFIFAPLCMSLIFEGALITAGQINRFHCKKASSN